MRKLLIATHNKGKLPEIKAALDGVDFALVSLNDIGIHDDVQETGTTLEENAILKAQSYGKQAGLLTLADDGGLEVDALDGRPGVYSDRYAPTPEQRIAKLLDELKDVPESKRTAQFRVVMALYDPTNDKTQTTTAKLVCTIPFEPKGDLGFGYSPVMYIPDLQKTMSELTLEERNAISHRGKALAKIKDILKKEFV